jgi:O-antigen ligase
MKTINSADNRNLGRKALSVLFPIMLVLSVWPAYYYYPIHMFRLLVALSAALMYVWFRGRQEGKLHMPKWWWVVAGLFGYFVVSMFLHPNLHAGLARLSLLAGCGVLFFFVRDAINNYLDRELVLSGLLLAVSGMLAIALIDVAGAYQDWRAAVGPGIPPPYAYRLELPVHANHMIALANLLMPAALVGVLLAKRWQARILLMFWLADYVVVAWFASSRGGYVGAAASLGVLVILVVDWKGLYNKFRGLSVGWKIIILLAILVAAAVAAWLGYSLLLESGAHPSHGSSDEGLNLNRVGIWTAYLNVLKDHPLFGAGIGRSVYGVLESNRTIPPGWLPIHSHNMVLGFLSEFGLAGGALVIGVIAAAAIWMVRSFYRLPRTKRTLAASVLAGAASLGAHAQFDDFLLEPLVMLVGIILLGWLAASFDIAGISNSKHVKVGWLGVLAGFASLTAFLALWPTRGISTAILDRQYGGEMTTRERAELVEASLRGPVASPYLAVQSAMFWDQVLPNTGEAVPWFLDALEIERDQSVVYMNLAALYWRAGDQTEALEAVDKALNLAPSEPVYLLNRGWYLEEMGAADRAYQDYLAALENGAKFGWHSHPFWKQTGLREGVLADWRADNQEEGVRSEIRGVITALENGDLASAMQISAEVSWTSGANDAALDLMLRGLLALDRGETADGATLIVSSYRHTYKPLRLASLGTWQRFYFRTIGLDYPFVDGVLQLSEDFGQVGEFELIHDFAAERLEEDELRQIEREYLFALVGGIADPSALETQ